MLRDTVDIFMQVATERRRRALRRQDRQRRREDRRSRSPARRRSAWRASGRAAISRSSARSRCSTACRRALLGPIMRTISYLIYDLDLDLSRFGVVKDEFGTRDGRATSARSASDAAFGPLVPFSRTPMVVLMGKVEDRVVAENGRPVVRPMMTLVRDARPPLHGRLPRRRDGAHLLRVPAQPGARCRGAAQGVRGRRAAGATEPSALRPSR